MLEINRVILSGKCMDKPKTYNMTSKKTKITPTAELIMQIGGNNLPIFFEGYEIVSNCDKYLRKDMSIMVEGRLIALDNKMYVRADNVVFLENAKKEEIYD